MKEGVILLASQILIIIMPNIDHQPLKNSRIIGERSRNTEIMKLAKNSIIRHPNYLLKMNIQINE